MTDDISKVEVVARSLASTLTGVGNTDATWREYAPDAEAALAALESATTPKLYSMESVIAEMPQETQGYYSDLSDAERAQMIATDTIWTVHVYPNTPVGFNVYHASTLDAAIDKARATGEGEGHD